MLLITIAALGQFHFIIPLNEDYTGGTYVFSPLNAPNLVLAEDSLDEFDYQAYVRGILEASPEVNKGLNHNQGQSKDGTGKCDEFLLLFKCSLLFYVGVVKSPNAGSIMLFTSKAILHNHIIKAGVRYVILGK